MLILFNPVNTCLSFFKVALVVGQSWDLLVFVYFISKAAPQTIRLLRPAKYFLLCLAMLPISEIAKYFCGVHLVITSNSSIVIWKATCSNQNITHVMKSDTNSEYSKTEATKSPI